jgi:hypothetical protein
VSTAPEHRADAYPTPLREAELAAIAARRQQATQDPAPPLVGIALSGGGIRSATFCLGLFQTLARHQLVRRMDFLSTVSGGGYFGSFLGTAFNRPHSSPESVESELADNHSWSVSWLRENGRFLSPNGAADNWQAAAVALRNWVSLQVVLLTFGLLILALATLIRADLSSADMTRGIWLPLENFFWRNRSAHFWWSPWLVLPVISFGVAMVPSGTLYWLTQAMPAMDLLRRASGCFVVRFRKMTAIEFAGRLQGALSRLFMVGLLGTVLLCGFALVDSVGQSLYSLWSHAGFRFPSLWTFSTGAGAVAFGFGARAALQLEEALGKRRVRVPFNVVALGLSFGWLSLGVSALAIVACGFGWGWHAPFSNREMIEPMSGGWGLMLTVAIAFTTSWIFSRSFGFVNLSSLQQTYGARLARAYLGANNQERRQSANHDMTELMPGDDLPLEDYSPHLHGGPLHLINITINETLSGKTQVERRDRKGLSFATGPCGLSVGTDSHALWASAHGSHHREGSNGTPGKSAERAILPVRSDGNRFCSLRHPAADGKHSTQRIEALSLGRWTAISGAAFTTGTGANTSLGLSLLLGLGNVRLGYWWDSGIHPSERPSAHRPNFLELGSRLLSAVLPVQTCLLNEFLARFHGPARRHWYLSDGGHFENTACYELVRRRVPFIVCSDAGQDPRYEFADLANLTRKARTDFGAEIQIIRRAADQATDDPGVKFPLPKLEQLVHPSLLDVIGVPEDFRPLVEAPDESSARPHYSRRHAVLARIHYIDTNEFCWLLVVKPSLMGDESMDVIQYQRSHALFPQEPTTDQYFDEAQWESYRKLGEHIGSELFTPPIGAVQKGGATWSPSEFCAPRVVPDLLSTVTQSSSSAIANN